MTQWEWHRLLYLLALIIVVAPGAYWLNRRNPHWLRHIAIWLAIAVAIALIYQFAVAP